MKNSPTEPKNSTATSRCPQCTSRLNSSATMTAHHPALYFVDSSPDGDACLPTHYPILFQEPLRRRNSPPTEFSFGFLTPPWIWMVLTTWSLFQNQGGRLGWENTQSTSSPRWRKGGHPPPSLPQMLTGTCWAHPQDRAAAPSSSIHAASRGLPLMAVPVDARALHASLILHMSHWTRSSLGHRSSPWHSGICGRALLQSIHLSAHGRGGMTVLVAPGSHRAQCVPKAPHFHGATRKL